MSGLLHHFMGIFPDAMEYPTELLLIIIDIFILS